MGKLIDAVLLRALGDAHGDDLRGEDQDVAALQGAVLPSIIPLGGVFVNGVVLKNEFSEQSFPVPGHRVHSVEGDSGAYGCKGVPGEIQVGHRVDEEGVIIGAEAQVVGELPRLEAPHVALAHPGHHGLHQAVVLHAGEVVPQNLPHPVALQGRLVQELLDELPADLRVLDGLLHQVLEVDHLRAVGAQALGKGVMLRLGHLQVGDVVKEQALQVLGHQVLQLPPRPVEHHLPQPPDL